MHWLVCYMQGSISELVPKICNANTELSRKLRRMPSYDEIAEALGMDVSTVRLVIERNRAPISIDQIVTTQGYMSLQVCPKSLLFQQLFSYISIANENFSLISCWKLN